MPLSCELITSPDALAALSPEWSTLLANSGGNEPMLSPIWVLNWWRVYGPLQGRSLCCLAFRRGERLIGLAPLCIRRYWHLGGIPLRRIELLGSGEEEEHETCSEYIGIIAERGEEQVIADAFAEALHDGTMPTWDEVVLTAMSGETVMPALLTRALGLNVDYKVLVGAPFARLPGTWDEYLNGLSSSRRALIRKSLRQWEKWAGEPPKLKRVNNASELNHGIELLIKLHEERWQSTGRPGAFDSKVFSDFHRQVAEELLEANSLWLCWLEVDNRPIAALYNMVWDKQVRFYQSGRTLDLPKKIRAGLVIHACAIQEAIEAGITQYDFLAGTTRYKMQLAHEVRPIVEVALRRPSFRDKLRRAGDRGLDLARAIRAR